MAENASAPGIPGVQGSAARVFDLEQRRFASMPVFDAHKPGYDYFLYRRHSDTRKLQPGALGRSSSSGIMTMMEHSGTHVDALCHQAEDLQFYGCDSVVDVETQHGFLQGDAASLPIFLHPGHLLDATIPYGGGEVPPGTLVTSEDLEACSSRQGTEIAPGSVVVVRTGNDQYWNDTPRYLAGPGLAPSASQWLADKDVFAVGADNMAWDLPGYVDDTVNCDLPGHLILLVRSGIYIFENLALQSLAKAEVYDFTFVASPLKFVGATGSPIRPLAIAES
jgi:kynurenine formamidase